MNTQQISASDYNLLTKKCLLWLGFGWVGFLLTLTGFFYAWIVWAVFLAGAIALSVNLFKKHGPFKLSRELTLISLGIFIFVITLSFFTSPTLFSGRDQGSISEAAIRLAQNHSLVFSNPAGDTFFKLRGAGRSLNFPGFFYTSSGELITQFPLVYISWLASFYGIFGIMGLTIANAVLSLLFLFTFYSLARVFMPIRGSIISLLFAATSLSVFWFPKYTLSENMALPLVWLSIFATISFLRNQNRLNLLLLLSSSVLLIFTRIEGVAFFLICAAITVFNKNTRTYLKNTLGWKFFIFLGFLFAILIANATWDINFYKEIVKAVLPPITPPQTTSLGTVGDPAVSNFYMLKVFYLYGMLSFFVLSAVACIFYATKKNIPKLIPFLIVAPTLIYLLNSHISADHPWMLRRFAFSVLPGTIFYCALILDDWQEYLISTKRNLALRVLPSIVALFLIAGNMPAFLNFVTFSENENLLPQTQQLSKRFSSNDLVLIDRLTTDDGWSMISGPMNFLYGKNTAYFFNIEDLTKIELKSFDNVYLIAPDSKITYYENSAIAKLLTPDGQYTLSTSRLGLDQEFTNSKNSFPEKRSIISHGTIFKVSK